MSDPTTAFVTTPALRIEYLEWNPAGRPCALLMHGWPDAPRSWNRVAERLAAGGLRVLAPALRGFGGTRFLHDDAPRSGQLSALGRDTIDLVEALGLNQPILVGHDWGARAVSNAFGLRMDIGSHLVLMSVGYGTNDPKQQLSYLQARNYWYHWFMATDRGERAVRQDRRAFTRFLWDTWSPPGWYAPEEFDRTATAFDNPDWADIVLHSYRHRWGYAPAFPAYAAEEARLVPAPPLSVPTLVIHGLADTCNDPDTSAGKEQFFTGRYERVLLKGVGHFPQREAPEPVAQAILEFCGLSVSGVRG